MKKSLRKEMNDYLTARWNFEDTFDQYKSTKEKYLITPEIQRILDHQQFNLNNSVLDYKIADLAVRFAFLRSPINGVVTHIDYPTSGINITPTDFSITIIDPSNLYFKAEVDEEDVPQIFPKQKAQITLDSFPDLQIDSEVSDIAFISVEGQTSTSYRIKFTFPLGNEDLKYRFGMSGEAKIKIADVKDVLSLPTEAIFEEIEAVILAGLGGLTGIFFGWLLLC